VKQPGIVDWATPLLFLVLSIVAAVIPQHEANHVQSEMVSYPIWFSDGDARVYCDVAAIRGCAASFNDTSVTKVGCCTFLAAGEVPGNTVSVAVLVVETFVLPVVIFCAACAPIFMKEGSYSLASFGAEINAASLGWLTGVLMSSAVMGFFKRIIGYPRPNSFSLQALGEYDTATGRTTYESATHEAYTNFPSGHASLITSAMVFVSLYLSSKVQKAMPFSAGSNGLRLLAASLCYLPFFLAMYVSASRVLDYWHSPACVCLGMLDGAICAFFGWTVASEPYLSRLWSTHDGSKAKVDVEVAQDIGIAAHPPVQAAVA